MKKTLTLLAALATVPTLTAPVAAQDMSAFLNPGALASQMGLTRPGATVRMPATVALATPEVPNLRAAPVIVTSRVAPVTSIRPIGRPVQGVATVVPTEVITATTHSLAVEVDDIRPAEMEALMEDVAAAAPAGANTAVIVTDQPVRQTFWQRWFSF